jgi:hypothetical protein
MRHRVTYQAADAPISVGKRVDVIEAMMRGGHRHHAPRLPERLEAVVLLEVAHEVGNPLARWRQVTTHLHILLGA